MADLKVLIKQGEGISVVNPFPAKFIIERGQVRTENSNSHTASVSSIRRPFPRSPRIQ